MRPGKDVTITAFSIMVGKAMEAAEALAAEGIDAEVIDLRSLRPLDTETIVASVQKTNRLVTTARRAGVSPASAPRLRRRSWNRLSTGSTRRSKRVYGIDVPMPYAANLEALALPQASNIAAGGQRSLLPRLGLRKRGPRHANQYSDAGAFADHDRRQPGQVAGEGGRRDRLRRRDRRDRDRQGDHGGRGGRRGHHRQDLRARGHRGGGGQCR